MWERGDVVIVGRGGQEILAGKPQTLHVRFVASIDERINQVMVDEDITFSKASKKIETIDKQRAHYLKHHYDMDWMDAKPYHLVLNTSLMSIEQAVKIITTAVYQQQKNET